MSSQENTFTHPHMDMPPTCKSLILGAAFRIVICSAMGPGAKMYTCSVVSQAQGTPLPLLFFTPLFFPSLLLLLSLSIYLHYECSKMVI